MLRELGEETVRENLIEEARASMVSTGMWNMDTLNRRVESLTNKDVVLGEEE